MGIFSSTEDLRKIAKLEKDNEMLRERLRKACKAWTSDRLIAGQPPSPMLHLYTEPGTDVDALIREVRENLNLWSTSNQVRPHDDT